MIPIPDMPEVIDTRPESKSQRVGPHDAMPPPKGIETESEVPIPRQSSVRIPSVIARDSLDTPMRPEPFLCTNAYPNDEPSPLSADEFELELAPRRDVHSNTRLHIIVGIVGVVLVLCFGIWGWMMSYSAGQDPIAPTPAQASAVPVDTARAASQAPEAAPVNSAVALNGDDTHEAPAAVPEFIDMKEVMPGIHSTKMPDGISVYSGALFVKGPPDGVVYASGVEVGVTDNWIKITCDRSHYVRVGAKSGDKKSKDVVWLATGRSVKVVCGRGTVVDGSNAD